MPNNVDFCLITGASSGIGRELAISLSKDNLLILNGRNVVRLEETKQACHNAQEHIIWPYDLTNVSNIDKSLEEFLFKQEIRVSRFVHCAGILDIIPVRMITNENLLTVLNVNFISAAMITTCLVKKKVNEHFLKSIVFVSSIASEFGTKGFAAYSASKGALDSYMRSAAVELAPRVRVNSVLPGGIVTKMTENLYNDDEIAERLVKDYPLGMGKASDIVEIVQFLLSDKARWITGQQFVVDGGRTANISA